MGAPSSPSVNGHKVAAMVYDYFKHHQVSTMAVDVFLPSLRGQRMGMWVPWSTPTQLGNPMAPNPTTTSLGSASWMTWSARMSWMAPQTSRIAWAAVHFPIPKEWVMYLWLAGMARLRIVWPHISPGMGDWCHHSWRGGAHAPSPATSQQSFPCSQTC